MNRHIVLLGLIVAVLAPSPTYAESRSIAVVVKRLGDQKIRVSIHSSMGEENQRDLTVPEAAAILKNARGWGSGVHIAIVSDGAYLMSYLELVTPRFLASASVADGKIYTIGCDRAGRVTVRYTFSILMCSRT